jgi:hypothetical protein
MEVLGINHAAGINRISPQEALAAGQSPEWRVRWNAWADKVAVGKLSPELAKEGNELMDILQKTAHDKLVSSQRVIADGRHIPYSYLPSIDMDGNNTTLDKVSAKPLPKVGDIVNGHRFKGGNPNVRANWE